MIEKDNTNDQRAAILSVKKILTILMKENLELLQIIFEEKRWRVIRKDGVCVQVGRGFGVGDNNEANDSRIIFTIHSLFQLKGYCNLYAKKRGISIRLL